MHRPTNILIVEDDNTVARVFERLARERRWTCAVAGSAEEAMKQAGRQMFECAVVDILLPGFSGIQLLDHFKKNGVMTEVVIMTGAGSVDLAVTAMRAGAYDYITKPFDDIERVGVILEKAMERYRLVQEIGRLERKSRDRQSFEGMVGSSRRMQEIYDVIESIAPTQSTVLVTGESGTGKELVARAIHNRSPRKHKKFVVINCAAIPSHLLESELFGHRKGSFTGAIADKRGLFEEADGGTIFMDEIGEMPPSLQVKIMRVLQEGEVRAVGDVSSSHVDVRMIAATNRDLVADVRTGKFREDLYYRLNVIGISMPPLRERPEDIPLLAYHFLEKCSAKIKKKADRIAVDAMQALQGYSWLGNVRELENVIERAVVLTHGGAITARDLPPKILGKSFYVEDSGAGVFPAYKEAKKRAMAAFNQAYLAGLLKETGGNISFASERAGMDRSNFKKLVKRAGVDIAEMQKREKE